MPPAPHPEALTFHAIPQLLALLGLGGLTVGVLPVGLTRRGSRLAVLGGGGCPRLGAAAQRMGTVWGVGGLGGLGRRHLLRGRLVGHAFVHARDGGLWGKWALRALQSSPRSGFHRRIPQYAALPTPTSE